jgi:protocatechuate 3,4-dioxygenase beta subunit
MAPSLFRVSLSLCGCLSLLAQTAPTSAVIGGVVLDGSSSTPLRRAIVTLFTNETRPQEAVAWTDSNGRFSFSYLPAGRYGLRVNKQGYQPTGPGQESNRRPPEIITLGGGEVRADFVFRLQPANYVSGLVLDEDGDPVTGVQVSALRLGWQRRKRQWLSGPSAATDTTGRYRLTGLAPGRYIFAAGSLGNRNAVRIQPEVSSGQTPQQYVYDRQYFPGATRSDDATVMAVEGGREYSRIDFRLRSEAVVHMDGKLALPPGDTNITQASITLVDDGESPNRARFGVGVSPTDRVFRADQYPAGHYTLIANAMADGKPYRAVRAIDVPADGIRDLTINLEPGVGLSGTVKFEGPDAAKFKASFVNLTPGDGLPQTGPQTRAAVNKDGSFRFDSVLPGVWDIGAGPLPPDGYIKSMRLGNQDVLTEDMVIRSNTSEALNIVIGTQAAIVEGDVAHPDRQQRYYVLLAPEPKFQHVVSFYRTIITDETGHFQMKSVTPGKYLLLAFEEFDQQSIQDPDFLKPYASSALTASFKEGTNPAVKVPLIPVSARGSQ